MKSLVALILVCATAEATPRTIIVPAVASIHGAQGTFFRSEIHIFNHANVRVPILLSFHCWSRQNCGGAATIVLEPRADQILENVMPPETAGTLEIAYDDAGGPITVRSRMGCQVVPGVAVSAAHRVSLLDVGSPSPGARRNAGGYNPNDTPANTTWQSHRADGSLMGTSARVVAPKESFQFSTEPSAYVVVFSDVPIFTYVSGIDSQTGDAIFELGVEDSSEIVVECSRYKFTPGSGSTPLVLTAGGTYRLRFHSLDTTHGLSAIQQLGIGPAEITPDADYVVDITVPEELRGSRLNFSCTQKCGSGHGNMYGAIEIR